MDHTCTNRHYPRNGFLMFDDASFVRYEHIRIHIRDSQIILLTSTILLHLPMRQVQYLHSTFV